MVRTVDREDRERDRLVDRPLRDALDADEVAATSSLVPPSLGRDEDEVGVVDDAIRHEIEQLFGSDLDEDEGGERLA